MIYSGTGRGTEHPLHLPLRYIRLFNLLNNADTFLLSKKERNKNTDLVAMAVFGRVGRSIFYIFTFVLYRSWTKNSRNYCMCMLNIHMSQRQFFIFEDSQVVLYFFILKTT